MTATLQHQPASDSGTAFAPELGVYAGWVAHKRSFAARQSSPLPGSPTSLLFAGECFEPGGTPDWSLLADYRKKCDAFTAGLNGQFAGLLLDRARGHALLFNDRYGSERIYISEKDGATYFASEAKALLSVLPELRSFDDVGVAQLLAYGSTLDQRTLFRGVRLLPGASCWRFEVGKSPRKEVYFRPREWEENAPLTEAEFNNRFLSLFPSVLKEYLTSTESVGISLTGGLDTRMIMACLPPDSRIGSTYTYGGLQGNTLDARIAAEVAKLFDLPHTTLRLRTEFLDRFGDHVDRTVAVTDGCAGPLQAHELPLSSLAAALSPIRLTGNFGSEVLRSMSTLKADGPRASLIAEEFRDTVRDVIGGAADNPIHPLTYSAFREIPWHLHGRMAAGRSQLTIRTPYLDNRIVELAYRAPTQMRQSNDAALSFLARCHPTLAVLPTDRGLSANVQEAVGLARRGWAAVTFKIDHLYTEGLPTALVPADNLLEWLTKRGLLGLHKFLPYRRWFRTSLAPYAERVISDPQTQRMPFWDRKALRTLASDHASGRSNNLREIHTVLQLEAVQRLLLRDPAPTASTAKAPALEGKA